MAADDGTRRKTGHRRSPPVAAPQPDDWPEVWGTLAGSDEVHRFREFMRGLAGSQCLLCFGYVDDVRHYMPRWWTEVEETSIAEYEDEKWRKRDSETSYSLEAPGMGLPSS